jgi:hypothetical protein
MICRELINTNLREIPINFDRYEHLHPEGHRLISGWFDRAWAMRDSQGEDCFEAFIFAWIAFNGWATCISGLDDDYKYLDALKRNQMLSLDFERLVAIPESSFALHLVQFAAQWPIFDARVLRRRHIIVAYELDRRTVINHYLDAGVMAFAPQCWKRHNDTKGHAPLDWPHTLTALYRVRCNLFHGEKAAHSEMDQRIVSSAFRTLVYFLREAGYL